jgi:hypothetical protein
MLPFNLHRRALFVLFWGGCSGCQRLSAVQLGSGSGRQVAPKVALAAARQNPSCPLRATFFHPARRPLKKTPAFFFYLTLGFL